MSEQMRQTMGECDKTPEIYNHKGALRYIRYVLSIDITKSDVYNQRMNYCKGNKF